MIRRYNEQMLQEEVRQVLNQWRTQLESCEFVFVHAPSGNRKIVYNYPDAVLVQNGSNVRSIPFTTRRPTLNELKRVFIELSTLKSIHIDAETIQQFEQKQLEKYESQKSQLERSKAQKKTVDTIEKIEVDPDLEKLISLVKQNKAGVAIEFIRKHMNLPIAGLLPEHVEDTRHYPTMLHVAAGAGCNEFVACLLREHDADPTIVSDAGKSAYEVSKDKPTRNAFRRCMYDIPDKWDWLAEARVPSPLSEKQEAEQTAKDQKKLAKEKEKQRLIDLERAKVEAKREAKETETKFEKMQAQRAKANMMPIARALGVGSSAVNTANMSPEARMRLEREKRARAAEERMKRLGK
jgi:hypothetical protein